MAACYLLGVLGYGMGMLLSLHGHAPAGLAILCATALLAIAHFRSQVARSSDARPG